MVLPVSSMHLRFLLLACLLGVAGAAYPGSLPAKVKAVYLYHLGNFSNWSQEALPKDEFVICLRHGNAMARHLEALVAAGKQVQGRRLIVREYDDVRDVMDCQILYTAQRLPIDWAGANAKSAAATLTVGEGRSFVQCCGMIGFFSEGTKLRFVASPARAKNAGITISAKLLRLAEIYENE